MRDEPFSDNCYGFFAVAEFGSSVRLLADALFVLDAVKEEV